MSTQGVREYRGYRYRIIKRTIPISPDKDREEYYVQLPRKTWFGLGKEVWEPYIYRADIGPIVPEGKNIDFPFNRKFLRCWTFSVEKTEDHFKKTIDYIITGNRKISEEVVLKEEEND